MSNWIDHIIIPSAVILRQGLNVHLHKCKFCQRWSYELTDFPGGAPSIYWYKFCPHCGKRMDNKSIKEDE